MTFWTATLKNGKIVNENNEKWDNIKNEVCSLQISINEQIIALPNGADAYIQGKTASCNILNGQIVIEARYIGYKIRNNTVKLIINEKNNNISIENS